MNDNVTLLVVAGGKGLRMGHEIPKQYLLLDDKPIFLFSIDTFLKAFPSGEVVLVLPESHKNIAANYLLQYNLLDKVKLTIGGEERYHSVANGLAAVTNSLVMIHDAVRPFINVTLLTKLMHITSSIGNAIPCIPMVDSVRMIREETSEHLDRQAIRVIQTPQCFKTEEILKCFESGYNPIFTDDASVFQYGGNNINLVEGLKENIKITTPFDLKVATLIVKDFDFLS